MGDGLRISVLGEVGATSGGRVLDLGGRRQRAVLALLLVARGGIVTRDRLVDGVWGGAPPPSALGALHVYVSRLRNCLEPGQQARSRSGFIVSEGSGYILRIPDEAVDACSGRWAGAVAWSGVRGVRGRAVGPAGGGTPGGVA
jgi:DNA-binding SARP family transcriptional activator